ncbi:activating signal cointegrator 1 complex subunit 3 (predicted), isoform CRA_a [Rattus norvegicus]|nr:activating signal cointegrator 1 complex subunit 3 (predicted), isoform CRA_a [Rattus norvegicus]
MSDCYLGLDQQYDIFLNVTKADISTQINTEVPDVSTDLA